MTIDAHNQNILSMCNIKNVVVKWGVRDTTE